MMLSGIASGTALANTFLNSWHTAPPYCLHHGRPPHLVCRGDGSVMMENVPVFGYKPNAINHLLYMAVFEVKYWDYWSIQFV